LDDLCSLLHLGRDDEFLRSVNVHVLNLFSNLIVDGIIREHLKAHIGRFFDVKLSLCTAELVALLRLLGNFSMMDDACVSVGKYFSEVFEYVASESNVVRRQAWTVLLNLSCNKRCVDVILKTEAFDGFETGVKGIFTEKNEVILLKSIKFLCNVYQGMRIQNRKPFSRESILNALLSAKANLILQATLFLTQAGSASEEFADAQRLLLMLEDC
uniref:Arm_2 domain-containing protein n=1 Tax=Taenia asiatica TaxID=60517 RepID=A0A0R3WBU6_TAEAS